MSQYLCGIHRLSVGLDSAPNSLLLSWRARWVRRAMQELRFQAAGLFRPALYLLSQPETASATVCHNDGSRHARVATLIGSDALSVAETKEYGNSLSVQQVFGLDPR